MPRSSRLAELREALRCVGGCCALRLRPYRVSYFKRVPTEATHQGRPMVASEWTQVEVMAYNREDAATRVDPSLKPGRNCFVLSIVGEG